MFSESPLLHYKANHANFGSKFALKNQETIIKGQNMFFKVFLRSAVYVYGSKDEHR